MKQLKIKDFFLRLTRFILPKTDLEKRLEEISRLKDNPANHGKVAMMYLKLQHIHASLIGKGGDDSWNYFLAQTFEMQHKMYRELYFEKQRNDEGL